MTFFSSNNKTPIVYFCTSTKVVTLTVFSFSLNFLSFFAIHIISTLTYLHLFLSKMGSSICFL